MFQQPKDQYRKSCHSHLSPMDEAIRQQQKTEEHENAGWHKIDGQINSKGDCKRVIWSHEQKKRQKHDSYFDS